MPHVYPFQALMPEASAVKRISAVPYDVVDRSQAAALAEGNPLSFLRISRPEIELPEDADPYGDDVYERAVQNFERVCKEAPLSVDPDAHLYIYRITAGGHQQTGLVAAVAVDDYDDDTVKKHEKTRQDKEDDRTRHIVSTRSHSGPVFLLYKAEETIRATCEQIAEAEPLFDFVAEDRSRHQVWQCPAELTQRLVDAFGGLDALYVADGHHRAKSASRAREECRKANADHTGDEDYNRFLAVMFPDNELQILPYNRVVHDLNGLSPDQFLTQMGECCKVTDSAADMPLAPGHVSMYLSGKWYDLSFDRGPQEKMDPDTLDVSLLQNAVLGPILGIEDPRTSKRISFVGGIHGPTRLIELVATGVGPVAFSMHPVRVEELIAVSDMGECMPPKSTWFEPKLRDGLLIHCF